MELDWAMLAETVQVREGLAFVLGGGIDTLTAPQLPVTLNAAVLVRLLLHRTESDRAHVVEARVLDQDGAQLAQLHSHVHAHVGEDLPLGWDVPMLVNFTIANLQLPSATPYSVEVLVDGIHLKSLNLRVRLLQAETASA